MLRVDDARASASDVLELAQDRSVSVKRIDVNRQVDPSAVVAPFLVLLDLLGVRQLQNPILLGQCPGVKCEYACAILEEDRREQLKPQEREDL